MGETSIDTEPAMEVGSHQARFLSVSSFVRLIVRKLSSNWIGKGLRGLAELTLSSFSSPLYLRLLRINRSQGVQGASSVMDCCMMDLRIQLVRLAIQRDFSHDLNIEELARPTNLSISYLCHLFKSEIGLTPAQYIKSLRMQETKLLLSTTFLSVKEIMNLVGIANSSHFCHDFTRLYGRTPTGYRLAKRLSNVVEPGQSTILDKE